MQITVDVPEELARLVEVLEWNYGRKPFTDKILCWLDNKLLEEYNPKKKAVTIPLTTLGLIELKDMQYRLTEAGQEFAKAWRLQACLKA